MGRYNKTAKGGPQFKPTELFMSSWIHSGSEKSDIGICFYCGEEASHFNNKLNIEICSDPQCLDEALRCSDSPTKDLVDIFNEGKEDY